jgi:hypothetical protein
MFSLSDIVNLIGLLHLFSQTVLQVHERRSLQQLEIILIRWLIFILFFYCDPIIADIFEIIPFGSLLYFYAKI